MRKIAPFLSGLALLILGSLFCCWQTFAQVGGLAFPGPGHPVASGGGSYTGIADVWSGVVAHWGVRAASSAQRGQKLLNVCDAATGLTCADWSSGASTGLIVPTTIGGSSCSSIACEVAEAYDDSGLSSCTVAGVVSPCNATAAHGSRPGLVLNSVNGLPSIVCSGTNSLTTVGGSFTSIYGPPFSLAFVGQRTGSTSSLGSAFSADNQIAIAGFNSVSGELFGYAGAILPTTGGATESVFHSLQFLNASTGKVQVDGSSPATGSSGAGSTADGAVDLCTDGFGDELSGNVAEAVFSPSDQSANFSAGYTNFHTYFGN